MKRALSRVRAWLWGRRVLSLETRDPATYDAYVSLGLTRLLESDDHDLAESCHEHVHYQSTPCVNGLTVAEYVHAIHAASVLEALMERAAFERIHRDTWRGVN